jgi:hypothetical protein
MHSPMRERPYAIIVLVLCFWVVGSGVQYPNMFPPPQISSSSSSYNPPIKMQRDLQSVLFEFRALVVFLRKGLLISKHFLSNRTIDILPPRAR